MRRLCQLVDAFGKYGQGIVYYSVSHHGQAFRLCAVSSPSILDQGACPIEKANYCVHDELAMVT